MDNVFVVEEESEADKFEAELTGTGSTASPSKAHSTSGSQAGRNGKQPAAAVIPPSAPPQPAAVRWSMPPVLALPGSNKNATSSSPTSAPAPSITASTPQSASDDTVRVFGRVPKLGLPAGDIPFSIRTTGSRSAGNMGDDEADEFEQSMMAGPAPDRSRDSRDGL